MSDEYGGNVAKNTLVDDSINKSGTTLDEKYKNYPPENDTTSSGGFSTTPDMWSDKVQRGNNSFETQGSTEKPTGGLIDQSLNGSNLKNELQDAKQGVDQDTRRDVN